MTNWPQNPFYSQELIDDTVLKFDSAKIEDYIDMKEGVSIPLSWPEYFLNMVDAVAAKSKDPRTQIGCIITGPDHGIRSTGYNGLPRGVNDNIPERWKYPLKAVFMAHAEVNAITQAAKVGTPLNGCTIYLPCLPCCGCTITIIQAGIKEIVYDYNNHKALINKYPVDDIPQWVKDLPCALEMIVEAGIQLTPYVSCSAG